MIAPVDRLVRLAAPMALIAVAVAGPARAESNTRLSDPSGTVEVRMPGTWRTEKSAHTLAASGFLGIARAKVFVQVYAGTPDAPGAVAKWKVWREKSSTITYTPHDDDPFAFTARSRVTTQFVRAMAGKGKSAVAWVEMKGGAATSADDAFSVLGTLAWAAAASSSSSSAGEKTDEKEAKPQTLKDPDFRIEFTLPGSFERVERTAETARRFALLEGPLGDDDTARLDLYAFPDFDRADALGVWWKESERAGWADAVKFEGDASRFQVLVQNRTWNRSVQILDTDAGLYAVKVDAESTAQREVDALLDSFGKDAVKVLRKRVHEANPPQGFSTLEHPTHIVHVKSASKGVEDVVELAEDAEKLLTGLLPLDPWDGRKGRLEVHPDREAYETAVRPMGVKKGTFCHWAPSTRRVITFAGAADTYEGAELILRALARDGVHRRLGFPAPFWIDYGFGLLVGGSVHTKGRTSVPDPQWVEGAKNGAGGSVDFEATRFWTHADSVSNRERLAVVWGFAYLFSEGSATSKKWAESLEAYLTTLRRTADPFEAGKSFDFARQAELVEDFKKRMRKL